LSNRIRGRRSLLLLACCLVVCAAAASAWQARAYCLFCFDPCNCGITIGGGGTYCIVTMQGNNCTCSLSGSNCTGGPRPTPDGLQLAPEIPTDSPGVIVGFNSAVLVGSGGLVDRLFAGRAYRVEPGFGLAGTVDQVIARTSAAGGAGNGELAFASAAAVMERVTNTLVHRSTSGDGYAVRVVPSPDGSRILVRALAAGRPEGRTLDVLVPTGSALLVPVGIDGARVIVCIWSLALAAADPEALDARFNDDRVAGFHRAFVESAKAFSGPLSTFARDMVCD
jgi:hypothetical protein